MTVEDLQEAFFNFDEEKTGSVSIQTLRELVTTDGEPMHDVCSSVYFSLFLRNTNIRI